MSTCSVSKHTYVVLVMAKSLALPEVCSDKEQTHMFALYSVFSYVTDWINVEARTL